LTAKSKPYTIARHMQQLLPEFLDFTHKADHGAEIYGVWPVSKLERLADLLLENSGEIHAELKFGKIDRLRVLSGVITADLAVTCQRCMQPMTQSLRSEFKFALIRDEDDDMPDDFDSLLLTDEPMNLIQILEDELLLSMPLVPMHEHACSEYLRKQIAGQHAEAEKARQQKEKENPFAALKGLIKD